MPVSSWDLVPGNNNGAPPNGWPEGMAPSDVNNVGRQMMADVRAFYDSAVLKTGSQVALPDGTAGAPALAFTNDLDCGLYRIGANNLGFAIAGAKVIDYGASAINFTATIQQSGTAVATVGNTTITGTWTFNNPIGASAGSNTAPSYSFGADTNTGFYNSAADEISIALGGSQKTVFSTSTFTHFGFVTGTSGYGLGGPGGVTAAVLLSGSGSPEGVVTAVVGSLFMRTDGGATTTLYVKTSGSGNTGWTAK